MFDDLVPNRHEGRRPFEAEFEIWNTIFPDRGTEVSSADPRFLTTMHQRFNHTTFASLTKKWSEESFECLLRRISVPPSDPTSSISPDLAIKFMTQTTISVRDAVRLIYGISPELSSSELPGRLQIEHMLLCDQVAWLLSDKEGNPAYELEYRSYSSIDDLLTLRASDSYFVCPIVRDCWIKLRDLNMNVRELGPFGQYEVLVALGIEQEQISRNDGSHASSKIKALEAKIKSLEDSSPLIRASLEKMVLAMAINQYDYDPKAARNNATTNIASALELYGLSLDHGTIRERLRDAFQSHGDQLDLSKD